MANLDFYSGILVHILKNLTFCLSSTLLLACSDGPTNTLQLATQGLLSGDLSANGSLAVIGSIHHGGSLWDLNNNERIFSWNHQSESMSTLRAVGLSKDGKRAVTCEEDALVVWDTETGKALQFWRAEDRIHSISLNAKGNRALIGMRNGQVSFFDLDRGMTLFTFRHSAEVRTTSLSSDGTKGLSAGDDKLIKVYDLVIGKEIESRTLNNQIKTAALSPSGRLAFASAQREQSIVWNIETKDTLLEKDNRITNYTVAAFSEDENQLTLGTFSGQIVRWDINTGNETGNWQAKPRQAYGAATSKAIISLIDTGTDIRVLTSDGMFQSF